ncbi:MAG: NAD-dependent epimerase/dehydratase family protein [Acidiferrobacteraceae bacterium]
MRVVVTGSASRLAEVVIPRLLSDPGITHVTGIDLRPSAFTHPRFASHVMDVRDRDAQVLIARANAVVHLAFVVMRSSLGPRKHDRELMRSLNVDGSGAVFRSAAAGDVRCVIHCSSASVYGWSDPGERLDEQAPLRALPGFFYAEDKIAVEHLLDEFVQTHPGLRIIRLRPHAILGAHAQPILRNLAVGRIYPLLPHPQPLIQCVHEEDVAEAVVRALFAPEASGAFNLATEDADSLRAIVSSGRLAIGLPLAALRTLAALSWRYSRESTDPAWVTGLRHSLLLDSRRARDLLQWRPRYASLRACVASMKGPGIRDH